MRHQDQQPIHYLNLDMNFLDMKKKLIRDESQKKTEVPRTSSTGLRFMSPVYERACVRDSKKDENELWTCPFCNNKSITRNNYIRHLSVHKGGVDGFPLNPNPNPTPTVGRSGSVLQVTNRNIIGRFTGHSTYL